MNLTVYIALYGAFVSTVAIVWNIYNNLQDKPRIKITSKFGFFSSSKGAEGPFFFVKATNKGKRSVYLSSFGLRSGEEDLIPNRVTGVPCELKAGTSHNEFFKMNQLKDRPFDFVWYRDETGELYKSKSIKKKLNNYFKLNKDKLSQNELTGELV